MTDQTDRILMSLATHIHEFALEDLPGPVQTKAKTHLLDTLGAIRIGHTSSLATKISRSLGILFSKSSTPAGLAFLGGVLAHAWEVDDSGGCDHSGAVTVPPLLALNSVYPMSGRALLESMVVGYEVGRRLQSSFGGYDAINGRGWHSTGVCGTVASAAACAHALRLSVERTAHAIAMATSFTGGTWSFMANGADSKKLHAGYASELGMRAAVMAQCGTTGSSDPFFSEWGGMFRTYAPETAPQPSFLEEDWGEPIWAVERASIKPYATCRSTHSMIDSLLEWRDELSLTPDRIASLNIQTSDLIMKMCGKRRWDSLADAQMSLIAGATAALLYGRVAPQDVEQIFTHQDHSEIAALVAKIRVEESSDLSGTDEPVLTLSLNVGQNGTRSRECGAPRGGMECPTSFSEVATKVHDLCDQSASESTVSWMIQQVEDIVGLDAVSTLADCVLTATRSIRGDAPQWTD